MKRIYLDYNSSTPLDKRVKAAMDEYSERFGNPSNLHYFGRETREGIEVARRKVADFLCCSPEEVFFTSGGTEANNWAIKGLAFKHLAEGKRGHIITSAIEHASVLNPCQFLERIGFSVTYLLPDENGWIAPDAVARAIREDTFLVSLMHANNELGTLEPISEISEILRKREIFFHTDAVASAGKIELDVKKLGVSALTISAHKIHGPKGVGALYLKKGIQIENLIHGGHHEQGMRSGTENLLGIIGFGKACEITREEMATTVPKIRDLRDYLEEEVKRRIPDIRINGAGASRLCNTSSISFAYVEGEALLMNLDLEGIAVSSGSACSAGEVSHVLQALSLPPEFINSTVRFSLGRENTRAEIEFTIDKLEGVVKRLREISPLKKRKE
jgi:cysteine desulfurase